MSVPPAMNQPEPSLIPLAPLVSRQHVVRLALARETGHAWTEALALGVLAQVAVERATYREAACLCAENLRVSQALGDQRGVAGVLGTLAGAFLAAGQPRYATRLLAAARTLAD